jgi:hypothetical protein
MLTKTQAIRMKLGGSPSLAEDFPEKPKSVHWRTYERLRQKANEAEDQSWPPWMFKMLARTGNPLTQGNEKSYKSKVAFRAVANP